MGFLVSSLLDSAILSVMLLPCSIMGSMLKVCSFDGRLSVLYHNSCPLDVKRVSIQKSSILFDMYTEIDVIYNVKS